MQEPDGKENSEKTASQDSVPLEIKIQVFLFSVCTRMLMFTFPFSLSHPTPLRVSPHENHLNAGWERMIGRVNSPLAFAHTFSFWVAVIYLNTVVL